MHFKVLAHQCAALIYMHMATIITCAGPPEPLNPLTPGPLDP